MRAGIDVRRARLDALGVGRVTLRLPGQAEDPGIPRVAGEAVGGINAEEEAADGEEGLPAADLECALLPRVQVDLGEGAAVPEEGKVAAHLDRVLPSPILEGVEAWVAVQGQLERDGEITIKITRQLIIKLVRRRNKYSKLNSIKSPY